MTTGERKAASNGIFLCSNCAGMIDKNKGVDFPEDLLRSWKAEHGEWVAANLNKRKGAGGKGGGGTIIGNRGVVVGGRGGDSGPHGPGGDGGSGFIKGDDGLIIGGDAGSGGTPDGRGGRGARGPNERFGHPTFIWGYGRGGSGQNRPEYDRRIGILKRVRTEYMAKSPQDTPFIDAGVDQVPINWVNQRLAELQENWLVEMGPSGYILPPLTVSNPGGSDRCSTTKPAGATKVVIVYSPNQSRVRMVIIPDDDREVPIHLANIAKGEAVIVGLLSDLYSFGQNAMLAAHTGKLPTSDRN